MGHGGEEGKELVHSADHPISEKPGGRGTIVIQSIGAWIAIATNAADRQRGTHTHSTGKNN